MYTDIVLWVSFVNLTSLTIKIIHIA